MNIKTQLASSGDRVKRARILAGITTRREFEKKHQISANTLQGWEQGKNPLSKKGAARIVESLKKEGLICSEKWLLTGEGMPPRSYESLHSTLQEDIADNNHTLIEQNLKEEEIIYKETQLFKQNVANSIVINITDNTMEPYFSCGDYLGGIRISNNRISDYVNHICIVELENNLILPRYLQKSPSEGRYTISSTNPKATTPPLNYYNTKVIAIAPIIWHRKKFSTLLKSLTD
jgi:transcriptional regulator with XRE-family HTH domain